MNLDLNSKICEVCRGSGRTYKIEFVNCDRCYGSGFTCGKGHRPRTCVTCEGKRKMFMKTIEHCDNNPNCKEGVIYIESSKL